MEVVDVVEIYGESFIRDMLKKALLTRGDLTNLYCDLFIKHRRNIYRKLRRVIIGELEIEDIEELRTLDQIMLALIIPQDKIPLYLYNTFGDALLLKDFLKYRLEHGHVS